MQYNPNNPSNGGVFGRFFGDPQSIKQVLGQGLPPPQSIKQVLGQGLPPQNNYTPPPGSFGTYDWHTGQVTGSTVPPPSWANQNTQPPPTPPPANPSVVTTAPAEKAYTSAADTANAVPPRPTGVPLTLSSSNPATQNIYDQINSALMNSPGVLQSNPQLAAALGALNNLGNQQQTATVNGQNAFQNNQYQQSYQNYQQANLLGQQAITGAAGVYATQIPQYQQQVINSSVPGQQERDLNSQLLDIQRQIGETNIAVKQGEKAQYGNGRPMDYSTVLANRVSWDAEAKQAYLQNTAEYLMKDLGLQQQYRQFGLEQGKTALDMFQNNLNVQLAVQGKLQEQQKNVLDAAAGMNSAQRQDFATLLDSMKGVNPATLSTDIKNQITQTAMSRGIPADALFNGLQTQYNELATRMLLQKAQAASWGYTGNTPTPTQNAFAGFGPGGGPAVGTTPNVSTLKTPSGQDAQPILDSIGYNPNAMTDQNATTYLQTGELPKGVSRPGLVSQTKARADEISQALGLGKFNPALRSAQVAADTKSLQGQQVVLDTVQKSFNVADANFKLMTDGMNGINTSQSPFFNSVRNAIKLNYTGDKLLNVFNTSIQTIRTEYSQILARGGQVTDENKREAASLIPNNISKDKLLAVFDRIRAEGKNVVDESQKQIDTISGRINNYPFSSVAKPKESSAPGTYTSSSGHVYKLPI